MANFSSDWLFNTVSPAKISSPASETNPQIGDHMGKDPALAAVQLARAENPSPVHVKRHVIETELKGEP